MSRTQEQIPSLDDRSKSQPSKPDIKLHSAEFYNSLSKVWLTRRALKRLDQQTSQVDNLQRPASTPRRITRNTSNKIQTFAKDGGPDLRDIRGYPAPTDIDLAHAMSSSHFRSSDNRQSKYTAPTSNPTPRTSKRTSAYDDNFEQFLVNHHIYIEGHDYSNGRESPEPYNLKEIHQRLAQPRPSLSSSCFTTADFKNFKKKDARVIIKDDIMRDVIPIIAGNSNIPNKQNLLFTQLDSITNNTTINTKPDFMKERILEISTKRSEKI